MTNKPQRSGNRLSRLRGDQPLRNCLLGGFRFSVKFRDCSKH